MVLISIKRLNPNILQSLRNRTKLSLIAFALTVAIVQIPSSISADEVETQGKTDNIILLADGQPTEAESKISSQSEWKQWILNDASLDLRSRTYYFYRGFDTRAPQEAFASGGALPYRTGRFREALQVGMTPYFSGKLYGPSDRDGTQLLKSGQRSFITMGEAFLDLSQGPFRTRIFRQELNLPFLNGFDTRMAPKTFESIYSEIEFSPLARLTLAQTFQMKDRDEVSFRSIAEQAGAAERQHGLTTIGLKEGTNQGLFKYQWVTHQLWDAWFQFYGETVFAWEHKDYGKLQWSQQFIHQSDIGAAVTGPLDANAFGSRLQWNLGSTQIRLAGTWTFEQDATIYPFGSHPGYTSLIERRFNRSGEKAAHIGLVQGLEPIGLKGLSVTANYTHGWTPNKGRRASPDQGEFDLTLGYRHKFNDKSEVELQVRGAWLKESFPSSIRFTEDYRCILQYNQSLF